MSGYSIVVGACYACGRLFGFNPYHVPSIPIDPRTKLPLDVDADGNSKPIEPDAVERAVREPLCPDCFERMNDAREARGEERVVPHPDAYEPIEGMPE